MMTKLALCLFSGLFLGISAHVVSADPAAKPVAPVELTGKAEDQAIKRADAFLSSAQTMVGDFVQTNSTDGRQSEGKIFIQKPGKLRFEYANPATLEVIADGNKVAVNDRKMKTQETYSIGNTPLKFLLQDKIDLKADTQILNVLQTPDEVMILVDDRTTFGGTSRIRLIFDAQTFQLNRWQVRDPQGYETLVTLYNIDLQQKPDPKLFKISAMDTAKK